MCPSSKGQGGGRNPCRGAAKAAWVQSGKDTQGFSPRRGQWRGEVPPTRIAWQLRMSKRVPELSL